MQTSPTLPRRAFLSQALCLAGAASTLQLGPVSRSALAAAQETNTAGEPADTRQALTVLSAQQTAVHINLVSGTLLNFGYKTPTGNQPEAYKNIAYLWPVSNNSIPWNSEPENQTQILLNRPSGDQNFKNINITTGAYIVGFAVGPKVPGTPWSPYLNVVASAYIPAQPTNARPPIARSTNLKPLYIGTNSLAYGFSFLPGYNPALSGAWVGLWEGEAASYVAPPRWASPILLTGNEGTSGLSGVILSTGEKYTLGLFASGYNQDSKKLDLLRRACTTVLAV